MKKLILFLISIIFLTGNVYGQDITLGPDGIWEEDFNDCPEIICDSTNSCVNAPCMNGATFLETGVPYNPPVCSGPTVYSAVLASADRLGAGMGIRVTHGLGTMTRYVVTTPTDSSTQRWIRYCVNYPNNFGCSNAKKQDIGVAGEQRAIAKWNNSQNVNLEAEGLTDIQSGWGPPDNAVPYTDGNYHCYEIHIDSVNQIFRFFVDGDFSHEITPNYPGNLWSGQNIPGNVSGGDCGDCQEVFFDDFAIADERYTGFVQDPTMGYNIIGMPGAAPTIIPTITGVRIQSGN